MNNRQAGAYRELVRKEERAREKWHEIHGHHLNSRSQSLGQPQSGGQTQQLPQAFPLPQQTVGPFQGGATFQPQNYSATQTFGRSLPAGQSLGAGQFGRSLPLSSSPIYDAALRISSPRLSADDSGDVYNADGSVQRRVVRQVEVPFTRQVKTAVTTRQLVPVLVEKKIKTRKFVEQPSTKLVNEEYDEVIEAPAIRTKEIWVKRLVPERYQQPHTIRKVRQVAVPTTVLREVDDYEVVQVTENRAVQVPGYRIDEVQDSKLVEVDEFLEFGKDGQATGRAQVLGARDIGPIQGFHHSRRVGTEVFHPLDARHAHVEEDSAPFSASGALRQRPLTGNADLRATAKSTFGAFQPRRSGASTFQPQPSFGATGTSNLGSTIGADQLLGFRVRDSDANAVVVYRVTPGEAAERAGVRTGDAILYVNNRPSRNLVEFRNVLQCSGGPVLLQVRRRGVQKLQLTVHR